jgi:hypothetical protein
MSDSDGRRKLAPVEALFCVLALLGAVFVVGYLASYLGEQRGREEAAAAYEQGRSEQDAALACARGTPTEISNCIHKEIAARTDQSHDQQDLQVQKDIALTGLVALFVSMISAGATIWALLYVKATLDATIEAVEDTGAATKAVIEANKIAQKALKTSTRPWVGVDAIDQRPINAGEPVTAAVHIRNSGASPALKFAVSSVGVLFPTGVPAPPCRDAIPDDQPRGVLFPNGVQTVHAFPGLTWTAENVLAITSGSYAMWIVGLIEYFDADDERHQTTFRVIYDLNSNGYVPSGLDDLAT